MQTEQQGSKESPLERRIDLAVGLAEIEREVEGRLRKIARTAKMAGFRPGKVPFKIVAQQYGPQARSEAIGEAVQRAFGDAVREQNLRVAGFPRLEPKSDAQSGKLEFSAVFEVYPEVVLGDISGSNVERPALEVGDAEVDKTIEVLRKQRMTYEPVERAAAEGDRVVIDFTGRMGGEIFQGGQATDFPVVLGSGSMLPEFESRLVGLSAGGEAEFDLAFPGDYHAKDLAGKTATFEVKLKRVEQQRLPEVDGEFARSLGIEDGDLGRMRREVRGNLEREVRKRIRNRVKEQVMNALLEVNPIEVPRALIEEEAAQMADAAGRDLKGRGMDPNQIGLDASWFKDQAARRVKLGLILAEVVKANGLTARPEQMRAMVDDFAQSYEDPAEVVRWYYSQRQQMAQVEALVIEENVVDWVLNNATVADKTISFDELMGSGA